MRIIAWTPVESASSVPLEPLPAQAILRYLHFVGSPQARLDGKHRIFVIRIACASMRSRPRMGALHRMKCR
jgi:hypothetical protein